MKLSQKVPSIKVGERTETFDDWRDFFAALHGWGHHKDFTYNDNVAQKLDKFVANFLLSYYIDVSEIELYYFLNDEVYEDFSKKELLQIFKTLQKFGVHGELPLKFIKHAT